MKPAIAFDQVGKRYRRYRRGSFREALSDAGRRILPLRGREQRREWLWAVKDLSFEVAQGRTIGLIGPNGAGKTTVLKLLSRVTRPSRGRITVNGRVSALIELGAGFHPDLTGRENVALNGAILGMARSEIEARYPDIVEFAGLGEFMDTPVKYYSSGMYARLGFAVAAHTNPDALLVDEVLAVGDYSFQQRCHDRMRRLQQQGTTIVLVSHNLSAIHDVCDGVIVLNDGEAVFQGDTPEGLAAYARLVRQPVSSKEAVAVGEDGIGKRIMTHAAKIVGVELLDAADRPVRVASPGDQVRLRAEVEFFEDASEPHFSCFVRDSQGRVVYDQTTMWQGLTTPGYSRGDRALVVFELELNLVEGLYQIGIDLHYNDLSCYYDRMENAASIVVSGGDGAKGISDLRCTFRFHPARERACDTARETSLP